MKILFDFSFETPVSYREGICVYNSMLFHALLESYKDLEIEIYTHEINIPTLQESLKTSLKKYKNRIHFITPTTNSLKDLIAKSKADIAFSDIVALTNTHLFSGPKVFMLHDLLTIPLANLFKSLVPDIKGLNQKTIENLKQYIKENTHFVTGTPYIRNKHFFKYISNKDNCTVIHYPPMLHDYSKTQLTPEKDIREKFGITGPYTFYPSQNRPNKNLILLLKALKRLKDKNINFTLVTTGKIETLRETLEYVQQNNLQDRIIETGSISEQELYTLYKYSSIAVVTTIMEGPGMPQQVLEPLTIGNIPVICTKCFGVKESLTTFGLFPENIDLNWIDITDDKGLANKIKKVLSNPLPHIEKQKHIIDAYIKRSWKDVAHDYMTIFKKICKDKKAHNTSLFQKILNILSKLTPIIIF